MREVDRQTSEKYGIPSILLMENAAHAAARVIAEKLGGSVAGKAFSIFCGKGSNGGDGAALARILWTLGAQVNVYLFGKVEDTKGDAKVHFEILKKIYDWDRDVPILGFVEVSDENFPDLHRLAVSKDVFVDAVFGTGLTRELEGDLKKIILHLRRVHNFRLPRGLRKPMIVSLDLPSGMNADSGAASVGNFIEAENVWADLTVTFTAPKLANVFPPASNFNGELYLVNIGTPEHLIDNSESKLFVSENIDAAVWLNRTRFTSDSYKNKRGHALLIVGSKEYTGAAVLAGNATMLSGVGLTTIATSESAQSAIAAKVLDEVITRSLPETKNGSIAAKAFETVEKLIENIDVVGIGCGLSSTEKTTKDFVREVVEKRRTPIVIDADGLNALSRFDLKGSEDLPLILTPHEGEFLRLLGTKDKDVIKDRVKVVRDFAEKHQVILVLKGERILIGAPDGTVVINPTGNPGLGKAGNGDTLTGIITGFVAQAVQMKIGIFETVVAAVYISSLAGDIAARKFGKHSMLASDVRECLVEAFAEIES